jgi:hypothetical protein
VGHVFFGECDIVAHGRISGVGCDGRGETINALRMFVGKPLQNRPVGRSRWEENIKMGLGR